LIGASPDRASRMVVREARPTESEELTRLAFCAKSHWGYSPEDLEAWTDELTISPQSIDSEPTFVVEHGPRIGAVLQLGTQAARWAIECLWVHPDSMRRGFGRALVRHAAAYAASQSQAWLVIDADPNAEAFYYALGADRVGEVQAPVVGNPQRVRLQLLLSTGTI